MRFFSLQKAVVRGEGPYKDSSVIQHSGIATASLRDAGHLSEAQGSDIGVQLLHGLDERALCHLGGPGLQLAQAQVVP